MAEVSPIDEDERQRLRLRIFGLVAVSLFAALFARLWYLQVLEREELQAQAATNILRVVPEQAPRGRILDVNGKVLVENKVVHVVTVDRKQLTEALTASQQEEMFLRLSKIVSGSGRLTKVSDIRSALSDPEFGPFDTVPVAFEVDPHLLVYLGERPDLFPGVEVVQRTVRSYPYGELAAHVLGYVGAITEAEYQSENARIDSSQEGAKPYQPSDEIGKTGIERMFEYELRGVPGQRVLEVDAHGVIIREIEEQGRAPIPGNDVYLTIDIDIQRLVEDELRRGLDWALDQPKADAEDPDYVASAGAAVALDPRDGSVVAMASFPTYDPREFIGGISTTLFQELTAPENFSPILNRAIQGEYAPGSTFKLVTAYAALTQGVIGNDPGALTAVDEFYEDTGSYTYPFCEADDATCTFRSPFPFTRFVDLREAIAVSSDTYFYRIGGEGFFARPRPADEGIQVASREFGLDEPTGIALPYERGGVVPDRAYFDEQYDAGVFLRNGEQWYTGDTIQLAIGQGDLLLTPLQLANVYATFANGGSLHQPNIASKVVDRFGEVVVDFGPRVVKEIPMPPGVTDPLLDGLNGVTATPGGTAWEAFNNHSSVLGVSFPLTSWPVAGKTGTSEKVGEADYALFAAFGPATYPELGIENEPEIVIATVLEQAGFGGDVAAPTVARMLEPIATGTVPRARTADEIEACYSEVSIMAQWYLGIRLGEIPIDSEGNVLVGEEPPLSEQCEELVGGKERIRELGIEALS
jgi:penicillin-binding protein 2